MMLGFCFLKCVFKTVALSLWKSESPVSVVQDGWKLCDWFMIIRSIHVALL